MQNVELFLQKLKEFESLNGHHICLLGNGVFETDEDDNFRKGEEEGIINLIYQFLQKSFPYLSWCRGGYIECHSIISTYQNYELIDHDRNECHICNPVSNKIQSSQSFVQSASAATNAIVEASKNTVANTFSLLKNSINLWTTIDNVKGKIRAESSKSDLDAQITQLEEKSTESGLILDIAKWKDSGEFSFFKCLEVVMKSDGLSDSSGSFSTRQRILAISKTFVLVLEPLPKNDDVDTSFAKLIYKDHIQNLSRITSKNPKKLSQPSDEVSNGPLYVIFYWKNGVEDKESDYIRRTFLVNDAKNCIETVKKYYKLI
jgi:hypothetical protein